MQKLWQIREASILWLNWKGQYTGSKQGLENYLSTLTPKQGLENYLSKISISLIGKRCLFSKNNMTGHLVKSCKNYLLLSMNLQLPLKRKGPKAPCWACSCWASLCCIFKLFPWVPANSCHSPWCFHANHFKVRTCGHQKHITQWVLPAFSL